MAKVGDAISRVRNVLKAVKEDPFLTDRFIYSVIMKYAKAVIRRQDVEGKIFMQKALFKELPCIDLIEVDRIEACCVGIRTGCTFMRSKDKLPKLMEGGEGPMIRTITTVDQSQTLQKTYPSVYANMTKIPNFKYNKNNYYWYLDGHIYIPGVMWEAVRMEAIFDESIEQLICSNDQNYCQPEQDRDLSIPDYLYAEIEQMAIQEILSTCSIPSDGADDSQNVLR